MPESTEPKPAKFQKKETQGLGFLAQEPSLFKPVDKKQEKIKALFGLGNPFKKLSSAKTLIATPSKFEIRSEPQPVKRGRGRPRKEESAQGTTEAAKPGIHEKIKQAKAEGQPARGRGRPPKSEASKRIDKEKVRKMKEAILKAKKRA